MLLKIQDLLPELNTTETASVIHAASDALRYCCGFARAYADLGINIGLFDNHEDDWIRDDIADIRDEQELVNLIISAGFRLQSLIK